jgi:dTDP-glucose 4,6-dehydratase
VVVAICTLLGLLEPAGAPNVKLITRVSDHPGHDRRYASNPTRMGTELG